MDLRTVLNESINLAGKSIGDKDFIRNFNRALNDLAMQYDSAKVRQSQTINCTSVNDEYDLTAGTMKIERVTFGGLYSKNFMVLGNSKITFYHTGTFEVDAMFMPPAITTMADEIPVNLAYIPAIENYVAAKSIKDDKEFSNELMEYYAKYASTANLNIRKANNPNRRVATRPFI